jgi:lipoprotein-anchoring transpeptidase ErfK/SrfK
MSNQANYPTRRAFVSLIPGALALSSCVTTQSANSRYPGPGYRVAEYDSGQKPGTIIVDPGTHFLYSVQDARQALQYEVGVGKEGYGWSGIATVHDKKEWPDWYPTADILQRKPEIRQYMVQLQSGNGMHGGPDNPLGARALYLWQDNADTLYRIHGTNEPDSIGHNVSSGCIRMRNESAVDLYERTPIGTKVIVLATRSVDA